MEQAQARRAESFPAVTEDRGVTQACGVHAALSDSNAADVVRDLVHDIRSPLTSIMLIAERLLRAEFGDVSDLQRRQLHILSGAALGLHALTSDVMDFAKGGGRLLDMEPCTFSVQELVESVAGMLEPLAIERGIDLRTSTRAHGLRWGPRAALTRILLNLATNALKFTDEGYVEIATKASTNGRVPFSVRDSGPGLLPQALEALLLPLGGARFEYPRERGLGLGMCRRLLRAMRSDLHVHSLAGSGTRFAFEVELPRSRPGSVTGPVPYAR